MTQIKVAFNVAKNIIDNYEYDERIIPKTIMNEFDNEKNQNMLITLKSIQNFYEKGDKKGLMTSLVTATDLLLKLIPEVAKFKINKKLSTIYDDKVLQEKYALNKEVIWSLNNSRIIRNEDIHNPLEENNTTLLEAVGYAHMLVLLISSTMASGKLKW